MVKIQKMIYDCASKKDFFALELAPDPSVPPSSQTSTWVYIISEWGFNLWLCENWRNSHIMHSWCPMFALRVYDWSIKRNSFETKIFVRTFVWKDICSKRQFVWNATYWDGILLGKHKIGKEKIGQTNRIVMILI